MAVARVVVVLTIKVAVVVVVAAVVVELPSRMQVTQIDIFQFLIRDPYLEPCDVCHCTDSNKYRVTREIIRRNVTLRVQCNS